MCAVRRLALTASRSGIHTRSALPKPTQAHRHPFSTSLSYAKTVPSSAASSATPRQASDTYTQGTHPEHAPNLIAPFPSESLEHLYAKRPSSPASAVPADHSSSTSVDPPHPTTTEKLQHTGEEAVGSSASVRYREPSWEDKAGGNYGVGLQDEQAVVKNKEGSQLPSKNEWPSEEQGRMGNQEAWKSRK